jgi:hypothetical protein
MGLVASVAQEDAAVVAVVVAAAVVATVRLSRSVEELFEPFPDAEWPLEAASC